MYFDVLKTLKNDLNFTYVVKQPKDMSYGTMLDDGTWNGIIGELHKKKADIGCVDLSVTEQRSQVCDFTVGLYISPAKLFMLNPKKSFSWTTFVAVFDDEFWMILSAVTVGIGILFYVIFLFVDGESTINVGTSVSTVLLSLVALEIPVDPSRVPGRILVFTVTLVYGALNFWAYNAGLVSYLTVDKLVFPITNMKDLAEKSDYNLILQSGIYNKCLLVHQQGGLPSERFDFREI